MPYNITNWITKRIECLVIPLSALYGMDDDLKRRGWVPDPPQIANITNTGDVLVDINISPGIISGRLLPDNSIMINGIDVSGEGSGHLYHEILLPSLRQSKGILEAVLIWEGGDSITRLISNDGDVIEVGIAL